MYVCMCVCVSYNAYIYIYIHKLYIIIPNHTHTYIYMPVTSWDFDSKFDFTADLTVENIEQGEPCQNLIHTIPKIPRKIRKNIPNMSNLGIQFSNPQDLIFIWAILVGKFLIPAQGPAAVAINTAVRSCVCTWQYLDSMGKCMGFSCGNHLQALVHHTLWWTNIAMENHHV